MYLILSRSVNKEGVGSTHAQYKACERGYIVIVIFIHFRLMRQAISLFVQPFFSILFNYIYIKSSDSSWAKSDVDFDFMVL